MNDWSRVRRMTETTAAVSLDDALSMIDQNLSELQARELVSASEVADLLLDLRMLLTLSPTDVSAVEVAPLS
jgi:hypothetical protein